VLGGAVLFAVAGSAALFAGPWLAGMDPTTHVYEAIVWVLVLWVLVHVGVGIIMQLFCIAARLGGRLTGRHDIHIQNVGLYWHFMAVTVLVTLAVLAGFPMVVR
jgi:cytochrome c oxidase subunit I+III